MQQEDEDGVYFKLQRGGVEIGSFVDGGVGTGIGLLVMVSTHVFASTLVLFISNIS